MIALQVQNLCKRFSSNARPAVEDVSFALHQGEILAMVGPSGCGKTTTLRLIAGLERPDQGSIFIKHELVAGQETFIPPERRGVGMMFQDHALFPHLSVVENIAFGLRGRPPGEIRERTHEMLRLVGLESLAKRYPHALSGGERQRVALARALAPQPVLILMDEPFSSLDADLRRAVREQVRSILKDLQATVIVVSHDQEEALYMGDRIGILHAGRLEQIDPPENIFHASRTRFVAEFMGNSDFLPSVQTANGIETPLGMLQQFNGQDPGVLVDVALRPDDLDFHPSERGNGYIVQRFFRGMDNLYRLQLHSGQILHALKAHTEIYPPGTRIQVQIIAGHPLVVFPVDK